MDCCPLVIDPLTLTALLAFIAAATYFLWGWNMTLLTFENSKYRKFCLNNCLCTYIYIHSRKLKYNLLKIVREEGLRTISKSNTIFVLTDSKHHKVASF